MLVVGLPELPGLPALVRDNQFDERWLGDSKRQRLFELTFKPSAGAAGESSSAIISDGERAAVQHGDLDAVVAFPPDFAAQLALFRERLLAGRQSQAASDQSSEPSVPRPVIYYNTASEKSQLAYDRVVGVLRLWAEAIGKQNLKDSQLPPTAAEPFEFEREDVAEVHQRNAAMWSKVLPFVLLIWALTGAFYPAIDLCAGEKERGTLETLLSSPAQRSEIVTGKLLTVMLFSVGTSVLNLLSMGITGILVLSHLPMRETGSPMALPPLVSCLWLLVALPAIAALIQRFVFVAGGICAAPKRVSTI